MNNTESELITLSNRLLQTIFTGDWKAYAELCDASLSCFEPEARGHLVEGLPFHKYYFDLKGSGSPKNVTIVSPHVRMLGPDAAVISYVRLVQGLDADGKPVTARGEETRVWQRIGGAWKHVHFHRSANA